MKKILLLIIVLLPACLFHNGNNCQTSYKFAIPFEANPTKDTLRVGDTLWVSSFFNDRLVDQISGNEFLFNQNKFYTEFLLFQIDTTPFRQAEGFDYITTIGQCNIIPLQDGLYTNLITPVYENGEYKFKMALVPHQKGNFYLHFLSLLYLDVKWEEECLNSGMIYFEYPMNDKADNNYYLIENSIDTTIRKDTRESYTTYGGHGFVVKE